MEGTAASTGENDFMLEALDDIKTELKEKQDALRELIVFETNLATKRSNLTPQGKWQGYLIYNL